MYNKRKRILSICTTRDSQTISFNTIFSEEAAESTITLAEQAHIATAKVEDQKLVVDLAAYFDKMSEADRILWNADARMLPSYHLSSVL